MIINNNKVQGIFLYSSEIEFTKNDLVVSGEYIYVCDAESISGIDPALDTGFEYYHPYSGSKIISASEFLQYVDNGDSSIGEKYVSAQAIMGILQSYQFGFNMEGVITDYIDENGDTTLALSTPTDRPLDNLMLTETLNRGTVKVSHELGQIVDGSINGIPFSTVFGFLTKNQPETSTPINYQLLLNQYTYKPSPDMYMRIQEMFSPLTGVSVYRYMSWSEDYFPKEGNVISGWRNVFSYSSAIQSKLDALQEYYTTLANQQKARVDALVGSFRFKEVYTGPGTSVTGLDNGVYTVNIQGVIGGSLTTDMERAESVVVRLSGSAFNLQLNSLSSFGYLSITVSSGKNNISLVRTSGTLNIISVYKREVKS